MINEEFIKYYKHSYKFKPQIICELKDIGNDIIYSYILTIDDDDIKSIKRSKELMKIYAEKSNELGLMYTKYEEKSFHEILIENIKKENKS